MSNLVIYLIGFLIFAVGLGYGAHKLGVSDQWIAIGALVLLGIAIMSGVSKTRLKEPPK